MTKSNTIVVAGLVCLDIMPILLHTPVKELTELLRPGQLVKASGVNLNTGGAVSNTGLGLKVLGGEVCLMGRVGDDEFGRIVLNKFKEYGVDNCVKISPDSSTAYSVVLNVPGVDRIFIHDPGSNDTFGMEDLNMEQIRNASIFHFGYPSTMRRMYLNGGEECVRMFQTVKRFGVTTSMDMSMVDTTSEAARVDWRRFMRDILPYVDIFAPSVEELSYMIDPEGYEQLTAAADGSDITGTVSKEYIRTLADELISWGAKIALIKCGAPGMYLRTGSVSQMKALRTGMDINSLDWADVDCYEQSYDPGTMRSGTGAGDTSIAGFLLAVQRGYPWKRCLELAAAAGASCIRGYDSLSGLRPLDELNAQIERGWPKLKLYRGESN